MDTSSEHYLDIALDTVMPPEIRENASQSLTDLAWLVGLQGVITPKQVVELAELVSSILYGNLVKGTTITVGEKDTKVLSGNEQLNATNGVLNLIRGNQIFQGLMNDVMMERGFEGFKVESNKGDAGELKIKI